MVCVKVFDFISDAIITTMELHTNLSSHEIEFFPRLETRIHISSYLTRTAKNGWENIETETAFFASVMATLVK